MPDRLAQVAIFLTDTLLGIYMIALWLRIILQVVRADFYNPISQLVWKVTQPPVMLLGKLIPRWRNIDIAALLLVWLGSVLNIYLQLTFRGADIPLASLFFWAAYKAVISLLWLYIASIFVQAILSWVNPSPNPLASILWSINEPLIRPVRRFLPPTGGIDWSPMVVLMGLYVLMILLQPF